MRLIARTKLDNNEIAYMSDTQKLYEVKEKLYKYECVADEPEKVVPIDRVLEIIDAEVWSYCDYIIKHENGNAYKQSAACHLSENIRNAVMALKGGDKE